MIRLVLWCLFILGTNLCFGQFKYSPVLKDYTGIQLLEKLKEFYKPLSVMDYGSARDTLFSMVYKENDSLACVYSDHKIYLPSDQDPTTFAYMNGSKDGINTEHAYPQSKGAVGGAKSDMNHLFPAKSNINESRGNLPYGESADNNTQKWFYKEIEFTSIPANNKDLYTELNALSFEPRESFKGNVARAIFYFYTMYNEEAIAADPNFFNIQVNTLCEWHSSDPVDSLEWTRAEIISKYQSNRKNPFILDCTLAYRTYCPNYPPICDTSNIVSLKNIWDSELSIFPNPVKSEFNICSGSNNQVDSICIYDLIGKPVLSQVNPGNENCIKINTQSIETKGLYFIKVIFKDTLHSGKYLIRKIIIN